MSQGLFTAASGIAANQASLNVIADNIANINTVAFKSSQINFETLFAQQLSAGSAPSNERGGINPMEIGLGCTISEVGRNFSNGSVMTTGRSTDLCIQGDGFFTVQNSANQTFLTRAGNFSMDASGYLVTPNGYYVIGTDSVASSAGGGTRRVQVPLKLNFVTPNAAANDNITNVGQESGSAIKEGTFTINLNDSAATITVTNIDTLESIRDKISSATGCTVNYNSDEGKITITADPADTISFNGSASDTSNFLSVMGFSESATTPGVYESAVLKDQSQVTIADPDNSSATASITTYSIGNDGAIDVTYSNGAKLTVTTNDATKGLKYTSANGRVITGINNIDNLSSVHPAQLQIQLATVINPKGLNVVGGNLFSLNSAAGDATYATPGTGGLGIVKSGSLEASNVDLPSEFSNMILAQRAIEASSRTFSAVNEILRTIVNLGR